MISYEDCLNYVYIENGTMESVLPSDVINIDIKEKIKNRVNESLSLSPSSLSLILVGVG